MGKLKKSPITIVKNGTIEDIEFLVEYLFNKEGFKFHDVPRRYYIIYHNNCPCGYVYSFAHEGQVVEVHTGFLKPFRGKVAVNFLKYCIADLKLEEPDTKVIASIDSDRKDLRLLLNILKYEYLNETEGKLNYVLSW